MSHCRSLALSSSRTAVLLINFTYSRHLRCNRYFPFIFCVNFRSHFSVGYCCLLVATVPLLVFAWSVISPIRFGSCGTQIRDVVIASVRYAEITACGGNCCEMFNTHLNGMTCKLAGPRPTDSFCPRNPVHEPLYEASFQASAAASPSSLEAGPSRFGLYMLQPAGASQSYG